MNESRNAKIILNKSGGTASKNSITYRVTLPTTWIKEIGVTEDDRNVKISIKNKKIIIEKE